MTMTAAKAVAGRRVEFAFYRDLTTYHPGIITGTEPGNDGDLLARVRLDGERHTLTVPAGYEGLRYLNEVGPVPDLPMGRFLPTVRDFGGFEYGGIPVCQLDDESVVVLTGDPAAARTAVIRFCSDMWLDLEFVGLDRMAAVWAVFEWQPEDAETPWTVRTDATEADDKAVRIHHLPA